MKVMILAAGVGSRLRPLTDTIPKPMLPIGGEPLLVHTLRWLKRYGVTDIALNVHYLPEVVREALGDGRAWGLHLRYSYERELLGTAGAVKRLAAFFDEPFVVVYGDLLVNIDLAALAAFHRERAALVTIGLKYTDDPASQGMIELGADGKVLRFVEKPQAWPANQHTANAGVYIVEPAVIERIPSNYTSDWGHDIFPQLLREDLPVFGRPVDGLLVDIGTHAVYERFKDGDPRLNQ